MSESKGARQGRWPLIGQAAALPIGAVLLAANCAELAGPARAAAILTWLLSCAWGVAEWGVTRRDLTREPASEDHGTFELYALARALLYYGGLLLPAWSTPPALWVLGPVLFASGATLRLVSIRSLGAAYSHYVRTWEGQPIVDTGPYRWIRHPAYAGTLVSQAGFVLSFMNPVSAASWLFLLLPAVLLRVRREEAALSAHPDYPRYSHGRRRLLPFLF